jgi:hypothetical protein
LGKNAAAPLARSSSDPWAPVSLPTPACPFPATPFALPSLPPSPPPRPTPTPAHDNTILLAYHSTHAYESSHHVHVRLPRVAYVHSHLNSALSGPGGGALRISRLIPSPCSSPAPLQFPSALNSTTHPDTAFAALLAATDHPAGTRWSRAARLPLRRLITTGQHRTGQDSLRNLPSSTEQCLFVDPASQPPPQPRRFPAS